MLVLALLPLLPFLALAFPTQQQPFSSTPEESMNNKINPLKHLSAISPFYIPTEKPTSLPPKCELGRVSLLIRHSSIQGNDDEFEQTMKPFIDKIQNIPKEDLPKAGPWKFLRDWDTPIKEETLEVVSPQGKKDAKFLGKYIRDQYQLLFPPKKKTSTKKDKNKTPYKVWTASSTRDIDTAKSYIKGGFPSHQSGDDGEGDGEVVQLVKVPNKAKDWDRSLTPHKACDTFEKESSLEPANKWLAVYAPKVIERLRGIIPEIADQLVDQDILAMQMLCGYESIAVGHSHFCHLFTDEEWLDVEYYFDVRFHYMMGYGSSLSPYLGMPWAKTAKHLLAGKDTDEGLHPSFTHRESPAFVAVFLNLFNSSSHPHPASEVPPLDHRVDDRAWRTSHLVSFLGHVALERFHCKGDKEEYVRAVVNGRAEKMSGCEDGKEGSCKWKTFDKWVDERAQRWGDWESVCEK
ncbi:hypothetical protein L486_00810 [Kwoniella mangroviensis CBS 10435]|uniref:Acid phosphatase n=1 Tax=Kwoniella mangroviensis CBS 10435 TaxID=1331196 RepID=A0A1B9J049_9TREE|nr:uncharacterized protein I203_04341 [Kwoniella mangroviensis CBS 8507]OCF61165.1 hypothetical protein L486_00810 [Kwoniella mangroviensis CBS 10435]OCF66764.1 hypothetical protein I203_04341 [Kwoniella mangroviensis CBS 8507]OCF77183.1 hypothetical protein I204_01168 [Kwoniella mangroviensis CBS 8886]